MKNQLAITDVLPYYADSNLSSPYDTAHKHNIFKEITCHRALSITKGRFTKPVMTLSIHGGQNTNT